MKKAIEFILYLIGILYLPTIVVISLTADQSGSFFEFSPLLLIILFLLMSFHFFCAFVEVGFSIIRLFPKKKLTKGEKILNVSTLAIAAVTLVLAIISPDNISVLAIYLSLILIVLWIVGDIAFKQKKFLPECFKKKSFWLSVVSVFITITVFLSATGGKFDKGQPDPIETALETRASNE